MLFEFKEQDCNVCDACSKVSDNLTLIESSWMGINLCDSCMKELDRCIVEYLDNKNMGGE